LILGGKEEKKKKKKKEKRGEKENFPGPFFLWAVVGRRRKKRRKKWGGTLFGIPPPFPFADHVLRKGEKRRLFRMCRPLSPEGCRGEEKGKISGRFPCRRV